MDSDVRADTCLLYLLRHGATENNRDDPPRLQGRRSDTPLSIEGQEQASRTGRFLASFALDGVFSSPLVRAQQTAAAISEPQGLPLGVVGGLVEVDVGNWEGRSWEDIRRDDPAAYQAFRDDPCVHPYRGGENINDVRSRIVPCLEKLMQANLGRRIVAVSHGVANRVYLAHLMGVPLASYRSIPQDNCGVNLLCHRHGRTEVITVNGVFHPDRARDRGP